MAQLTLTVISASPRTRALAAGFDAAVGQALQRHAPGTAMIGASTGTGTEAGPRHLAPGARQWQLSAPPAVARAIRDDIAPLADAAQCDVHLTRAPLAPIRLLIADMESTIIAEECLDELADRVGLRAPVAEITARAMRGDLDFEEALKARVALLKGLDAGELDALYRDRITLVEGARTLVATMKARGAYCALVSGGFTFFTERIAADLGFDGHRANRLIVEDGRLAGTVGEPILGRNAKRAALDDLTAHLAIEPGETIAVGDGANDLSMLEAAGLGVAFRAKPMVAEAADVSIRHGDLTSLLFLQGIPIADFVNA